MAEAEVGDDYFGEDPTVRLLEEETATALGKEAALFVPTGSMGNEVAIAVHTSPGDAILLDRFSHVAQVEAKAVTEMLGCRFVLRDAPRGLLSGSQVEEGLAGDEGGAIRLVEVENTHNWASGAVYPMDSLSSVARGAANRSIPVHMDGARLWNASAATGTPLEQYAAHAQSVMVCYSKGLGAPVGSAVAGSSVFIREARGARRTFGGAMRQSGILAAGALHALRHHRARLVEDHVRAKRLAEAIAETPGIELDPETICTNIIIADTGGDTGRLTAFVRAVASEGVRLYPFGGPGRFRAVTHLDVDDAGIDRAIRAIRAAAQAVLVS
jgi:threonine aldolase